MPSRARTCTPHTPQGPSQIFRFAIARRRPLLSFLDKQAYTGRTHWEWRTPRSSRTPSATKQTRSPPSTTVISAWYAQAHALLHAAALTAKRRACQAAITGEPRSVERGLIVFGTSNETQPPKPPSLNHERVSRSQTTARRCRGRPATGCRGLRGGNALG
jgi:hypothetical protein